MPRFNVAVDERWWFQVEADTEEAAEAKMEQLLLDDRVYSAAFDCEYEIEVCGEADAEREPATP